MYDLECIRKEAVMTYYKALLWYLLGEMEEIYKELMDSWCRNWDSNPACSERMLDVILREQDCSANDMLIGWNFPVVTCIS